MTGSGLEAITDDREWSGGPSGCPGVVGSLSRVSGCGRETLPDVREWSEGPLKCPGGLEDVREWSEALPFVREWSGDTSKCPGCPPGYLGVVGRPS